MMGKVFTAVLCNLILVTTACAGELVLEPREVDTGELAVLRWRGEVPSFGVVRFNDRIIPLSPDREGAVALLPVGLDLSPGAYPVRIAVADRQGRTTFAERLLQVRHKVRPLERLTLPERMVTPREPAVLERIRRESETLTALFARCSDRRWEGFRRPVDDPVNSVFGKRRLLNGKPRAPHSGTDFRSPTGTPVRTIGAGRVVLADDLFYTGLTVVVDHGTGLFSLYAHLSAAEVVPGEEVVAGQLVGRVGSSGRVTGPHLHLTVKLLGERIDPMALLRLLPAEES